MVPFIELLTNDDPIHLSETETRCLVRFGCRVGHRNPGHGSVTKTILVG